MGCCNSIEEVEANTVPPPLYTEPEAVSESLFKQAHDRLRRLRELDESTKVPFILIELTGEADGQGEIEVCGKDEYGIYEALQDYFETEWGCEWMDPGDETEDTKIPFCSASYRWPGFKVAGDEGMNNMGLMVMRVIDFVCSKQSWTLACINGGNVGPLGEVRESQIVFKAPHPMNLVAPHLMVELRSAGYIEVCADLDDRDADFLDKVDEFIMERFRAEKVEDHEEFCDRYYKAADGVFMGSGASLDNNFGLLVTDVCDRIAAFKGWSLVACNGGNYGQSSEHQEEQLVFRRDEHPLGDATYLMIVINQRGDVEVNGKPIRGIYDKLDQYLRKRWGCERLGRVEDHGTESRRYGWSDPEKIPEQVKDLVVAAGHVVAFFEKLGWEMQVCSQYLVKEEGEYCREQQLLFRPGKTEVGTVEPHMLVELYSGEGKQELYEDPEEPTQVLANQHIKIVPVGARGNYGDLVKDAVEKIDHFILNVLGGEKREESQPGVHTYSCNIFLCRGMYENNIAQWTMRACDFIVDSLGWSFISCTLCNNGESGQYRSQQLAFRWDGERRSVPVAKTRNSNNASSANNFELYTSMEKPAHWKNDLPQEPGQKGQFVVNCDEEEMEALQVMVDSTFKRVLTRDRQPDENAPEDEEMPYRLEVINALRSEHAMLQYKLSQRRERAGPLDEECSVKTSNEPTVLHERLMPGEAYLFHGSNPSSGMSILSSGFNVAHAGSSVGTMFGTGIYAAECSSKSDEYGRDDGGGTYPGLLAMLVCRCYVGNALVVDSKGDHTTTAKEAGMDTVIGDRESRVGTYREFIFPDEEQVYPEYVIIYRRVYDKKQVPESMVLPTTGTTGRYWQVRVDRDKGGGWRNLPPEVNKLLLAAGRKGESEVTLDFHGSEYTFNLEEKIGTNHTSGKRTQLRAPMQS